MLTRPDAPAGRGPAVRPLAGRRAGRRGRDPGAHPAPAADPEFLDALRALAPDCCRGRRLRRAGAAGRAGRPAARLGQPALLAAARLARRRAGAGRDLARRRDHRRRHVPARGGPRHRAGVRRGDRGGPARRHRRRPARPARPRPVPGCWRRRSTGSRTARSWPRPQPADGVSYAAEGHRRGRPGRLGGAGRGGGPAGPVACTPDPGRVDDLPRRAARARPGASRRPAGAAASSSPASCTSGSGGCWSGPARRPCVLGEVRPVGRRPMPAADWARGVRIAPGEGLA